MRLNVKQPVLDYEGKPLLTNKTNPDRTPVLGEDHRPVQEPEMLRNYLALALNNTAQGENEVFTPEQKAKIYALTTKLYSKREVDLTLDDRAFLKERVGKVYGPGNSMPAARGIAPRALRSAIGPRGAVRRRPHEIIDKIWWEHELLGQQRASAGSAALALPKLDARSGWSPSRAFLVGRRETGRLSGRATREMA